MSSAAKPVNQPDALRLLLDRTLCGADATLIAEGDATRVLLDLAADCLSGRRIRVLRAAEVLPSRPGAPMAHVGGPAPAGPDDDALSRSFRALTVLDPACDRIVLLAGDAQALKPSALRYIQFASRSAAHLQLVFCGTQAFFDVLNAEEFTWLRTRLRAGLVLTLAAPIPEEEDAPPVPPSVPDDPLAWARGAAAPLSGARGPAVSASRQSWPLRLGALALLGLGGAAGLMLGMPGGGADRPAAGRQDASVVQPPAPPDAPAPAGPLAGDAPHAAPGPAPAAPDAPSPSQPAPSQPAMAGDAQGAGPASPAGVPVPPPSTKAPGALVTVWSPPRAGMPENEPPPPGLARSLGRPGAPAASPRVAAAGSRARRLRDAKDQPAPPRDDQWAPTEPAFGSWTAPVSQPPRYIGSYTTDANGVRMFRLEP